jgi:branched-subunit amino acid ABC-type transport system permease component
LVGQYLYNSLQNFLFYCLLSYSFYLSSIGCRHFNFAVGAAFLCGPYAALNFLKWTNNFFFSFIAAALICGIVGFIYRELSVRLFRRGSGPGQLLIISLGILGIAENAISLLFGRNSQTLWNFNKSDVWLSIASVNITFQQIVFISVSGFIVLSCIFSWEYSLLGKLLRAMNDSRFGISLRGYSVNAIENAVSAMGFLFAGTAGILWATDVSIKPTMGMEAPLIGVVAYIAGPLLGRDLFGLALASLCMVALRLFISLSFEQDWGMTSNLLLLVIVLVVYYGRKLFYQTLD